jgi:hypothetical protein
MNMAREPIEFILKRANQFFKEVFPSDQVQAMALGITHDGDVRVLAEERNR